jgi:hypothetical protein
VVGLLGPTAAGHGQGSRPSASRSSRSHNRRPRLHGSLARLESRLKGRGLEAPKEVQRDKREGSRRSRSSLGHLAANAAEDQATRSARMIPLLKICARPSRHRLPSFTSRCHIDLAPGADPLMVARAPGQTGQMVVARDHGPRRRIMVNRDRDRGHSKAQTP